MVDKANVVFWLRVTFAVVAFCLGVGLIVAGLVMAVATGNYLWAVGGLGSGGAFTVSGLHIRAAQSLAVGINGSS